MNARRAGGICRYGAVSANPIVASPPSAGTATQGEARSTPPIETYVVGSLRFRRFELTSKLFVTKKKPAVGYLSAMNVASRSCTAIMAPPSQATATRRRRTDRIRKPKHSQAKPKIPIRADTKRLLLMANEKKTPAAAQRTGIRAWLASKK